MQQPDHDIDVSSAVVDETVPDKKQRDAYSSFRRGIPHADHVSHMHQRIEVQRETIEERDARYEAKNDREDMIWTLVSRFGKRFHFIHYRWIWWKFIMLIAHGYMKAFHRLEVRGKENIPEGGGIYYLLHNGDNDVIYFLAAMQKPFGVFTDVGVGYFADFMEHIFGFVTRRGYNYVMIEKMVQTILCKNKDFAMWPEGTPSHDAPAQGFSGIVKVYATVNAKRDLVPFVPVLMRGSETIAHDIAWAAKHPNKRAKHAGEWYHHHKHDPRLWKVLVEILKPVYIPREWLKPEEEGGKLPRELIDKLMLALARKAGYSTLKQNRALEHRRQQAGGPWKE
jgi:1-acyl-sn-glycerol-3-phosphate acyltransferase